jgi:hypothetical protein
MACMSTTERSKRPDAIESIDSNFSSHKWNLYEFGSTAVYEHILSHDMMLPDLFVVTSISEKSMLATSRVIISMMHMLTNKYHRVFIMKFCHSNNNIMDAQKSACMKRDEMKLEEKQVIIKKETATSFAEYKTISNIEEFYKPEIEFYINVARCVNHIITQELKLKNVELLGKSAGGCIAIYLANMASIYNALYLASPASPFQLKPLQRKTIKVHVGWPCNDIKYNCMKSVYDIQMEQYEQSYSSKIYGYWEDSDGHELHPDMLLSI